VDLRELARVRRWRWHYEESYRAERDPAARGDGRWYVEIPCRRGKVYPFGGELVAWVQRQEVLRELLALGPDVRIVQRGDQEGAVRFPVRLLDRVAVVLRPRRIGGRTATPEDIARLARTGFRAGLPGRKTEPGTTRRDSDGTEVHLPALDALDGPGADGMADA
jgi:hypothetical protein